MPKKVQAVMRGLLLKPGYMIGNNEKKLFSFMVAARACDSSLIT
jgi:hypothetical protein